ncbi:MAG: hypothetical protein HRT51_09310 [Colwellia sp.]|nr:hypothetical protein [Colwellia sp.]
MINLPFKSVFKATPPHLIIGVVLANLLSILATIGGFWLIGITNDKPSLSLGICAVLIAVLLQLVIFILLKEIVTLKNKQNNIMIRFVLIFGYLLFESINFGISASTVFMLSGLEAQYESKILNEQYKQVEISIYNASASLQSLVTKLDDVANYSKSLAKIEDEQGGSCGGPAKTEKGKYWRLRENDKTQAVLHAETVRAQNNQINALITSLSSTKLSAADTRKHLTNIAVNINSLMGDPAVSTTFTWARNRLQSISSGHTDQEYMSGISTFWCSDNKLATKLTTLLSVKLEKADIPEFYTSEGSNYIKLTFSKLGSLISGHLDELTSFDYLNFILSALLSLANPIFLYFYHKHNHICHVSVIQMHDKAKQLIDAISIDSLWAVEDWLETLPSHLRIMKNKYHFYLEDDKEARLIIFGLQQLEEMGIGKFRGHRNLFQMLIHPKLALNTLFKRNVPFLATFTPQEYAQLEALLTLLVSSEVQETCNA